MADYDRSGNGPEQETLFRKALATALLPYYFLTSRTAIKAYLTTILFLIASTILIGVSSAAYLIFYYNYIPAISLTKTLHLQYGIDKYPFAATALDSGALISQQPYDVDVLLQMPRTPTNLGAGNFMIDVQLLGRYNPLVESERALTSLLGNITLPSISGLTTISHSRRPAILPYQSPPLHLAQAALRLPLHLLGFQDLDSNTLRIPIFESLSFSRGIASVPTHVRVELQAKGPVATGLGPGIASPEIPLQVYSSSIEFSAKFQGLRYVVYRYRIFSYLVFTTLFYSVSVVALALAWTVFSYVFGKPSDLGVPIKQERSSAQPESDVSIKQEPEDSGSGLGLGGQVEARGASSSAQTAQAQQYIRPGETADDEEGTDEDVNTDGDNYDSNAVRDSGIGTSMESGYDRSLVRRRSGRLSAAAVLGIDLGTEYIKTAIAKPGSPIDIVLTKDSKRKEAATLAFKPSRAQANDPDALPERLYGGDATALASRFPGDVYPNLKSLLGVQPDSEAAQTYRRRYPGLHLEPVSRYTGDQTVETVGFVSKSAGATTEAFMVEELLAMQLKNIKANAQAGLPKGVFAYDAVITLPAFWTAEERRAVELAADLAGIHLLGLISDGLAVGLNYATGRTFESVTDGAAPEHHVVFDVGAGSTTATVLRFQGRTIKGAGKRNQTIQEVQVLGTGFDSTLGGDALNDVIVADIVSDLVQQPKVQQRGISENDFLSNPKAMARIWKEAERVRQVLSANSAASASFEELYDDLSLKYSLTREKFEALSKSIAARVEGPLIRALDAAGISLSAIDSVILHGGAGRTPFVQKALEAAVGTPDKIKANVNADEAAAMGAAFKAASLAPSFRVKDIRGLDVGGLTVSLDYTVDGKDRSQKLFTPQSVVGIEKHVPIKTLEDVNLSFADSSNSEPVRLTTIETTNLTKSVSQLKDKYDCAAANVSTTFVVRLSPLNGLPEVLSAAVSCKSARGKEGNVLDNVKGLFGFGSKKDTEQAVLGEEGADRTDSTEPASESPVEAPDSSSSSSTGSASASASTESPAASSSSAKAAKSEPTNVVVPVGLKTKQVRFNKPSTDALAKIRTRLSEFDSSDRRAVQRVEALNTLEAFTYRARDHLDDPAFIAVSSEQARQTLQDQLSATSEWLYGDGMDAKLQDFKNKLKELEALVEPVLIRKDENSKRGDGVRKIKEALDSLDNMVKLVQGQLEKAAQDAVLSASSTAAAASENTASTSSSPSQDDDLDDDPYSTSTDASEPAATPPAFEYKEEDLLSLTNTQTSVKQWLDEKLALQDKLGPYDDPAVRVAELESKAQEIQTLVSDTLMKSFKFEKPKKEKTKKAKKADVMSSRLKSLGFGSKRKSAVNNTTSLPSRPAVMNQPGLGRPPSYSYNTAAGRQAAYLGQSPQQLGHPQAPNYGGGYHHLPQHQQPLPQPLHGQPGGRQYLNTQQAGVGRPAEVEGGARNKAQLIVGIDFGTTFSGVAFAFATNTEAKEDIITEWPGAGNQTKQKIPTVLYYDQYQKVVGWGPDIADALAPTGYPKPGVQKVEWFKLQLMLSGNTYIDPINLPPLPPGKSEIDVAADYLFKLRQAMRFQLQKTLGEVFNREERNIRYFLTVPAIWNDAGKAATRAAAIQAGFIRDENDNRLTLITEPEAAAMFCSKTGLLNLKIHDAVLIVDCGGGTVDLIAYEVEEESPFTVAECTAGSGDSCGSTALNRNFSNILRAKIRKMKLPDGSKTAGRVYAKCIMDFENRIKADFRNNGQKWAVDVGIEAEFPEAGIEEGYMTFTNEEILQCFEPVVNRILELVRNQIIAIQAQNRSLQNVLVVGGFGASEYLFQQIKLHVPPQFQSKVVRPMDSVAAIVKGAVTAGITERVITSRVARRHYLMATLQPFKEGHHPEQYRVPSLDGKDRCKYTRQIFVQKGERVKIGEPVKVSFFRQVAPGATLMYEDILYACDEDVCPEYTKDPRIKEVVTLTSDLSRKNLEKDFERMDTPQGTFYRVYFDIYLTLDGSEFNAELVCQGEVMGRCSARFR
ncbi:hypothetical protein DV738_g2089, partial [Chaetothyriales sp. CBS 135597]